MLEKINLFCLNRSYDIGAINVKMDWSVLGEKLSVKILGFSFSSILNWGSQFIFIAKTNSKKIGALIHFMKLLSPEVALYLYNSTIFYSMHGILLSCLGWCS